jgi:hypothetical protein
MLRKMFALISLWVLSSNLNAAGIGYGPNLVDMQVGDTVGSGGLLVIAESDIPPFANILEVTFSVTYSYDTAALSFTTLSQNDAVYSQPAPGVIQLTGSASIGQCWEKVCDGTQIPGTWRVLTGGVTATALLVGEHYLTQESRAIFDVTNDRPLSFNFPLGPSITYSVSEVPIPAAAWLFGSALLGLVGIGRRKKV